ncbi:MAG: alpha,alpha-trehalose-phosphate synthase (UDP-forming) [Chloroflexota bacterium]
MNRRMAPTTATFQANGRRRKLVETCQAALQGRRLFLVSNRGPVEHVITHDGQIKTHRGSGGVVTALAALAQQVELTWIAAAMTEGDRRVAADPSLSGDSGALSARLSVRLLAIPEKVYQRYYNVFSNPLLWFVQHYMLDPAYSTLLVDQSARRAWERGYVVANRAFAEKLKDETAGLSQPPVVMVQDYQLYLVAGFARELGVNATFQHFVHIPWPAPDYWKFLPHDMRAAICAGLAANDVVGFQTPDYARNFLSSCEEFLDGAIVSHDDQTIRVDDHICRVRSYPISIDVTGLRRLADSRAVRRYREELRRRAGEQTIVRVDRLEPSKNIVRGFEAYGNLLERRPELVGRVKFLAFLVPSRTRLEEYQRYRKAVLDAIERINGRFARPGWQPIEVFYENNYAQAIAGMSLADALLVNPIMDGMNLVAKEGPIVNERNGVLVLSEGAGVHHQLGEAALSVASGDVEGTADALYNALVMPEAERALRLRHLREAIAAEDLDWWIRRQFEDLADLVAVPEQPSEDRLLAVS